MKLLPLLLVFTLPSAAHAYLPPAFFIYSKVAEQKAKNPVPTGVVLMVARPMAGGTEEILGSVVLSEWKASKGGWPSLSLIFEANQDSLIQTVSAFGIPVLKESDLFRVDKDKVKTLKDPPRPFYRVDQSVSLKRTRQTYAWVHGSKESEKSVWVEKDSFLPLKIAGPCPPSVSGLGWAKSGENKCEVEFRNLQALKRGNPQGARLTLWKDGSPVLFLSFDKVTSGKTLPPKDEDDRLPPEVKEITEAILH